MGGWATHRHGDPGWAQLHLSLSSPRIWASALAASKVKVIPSCGSWGMCSSASTTASLTGSTTAWGWPRPSDGTAEPGPGMCAPNRHAHAHTHAPAHIQIRFSGACFNKYRISAKRGFCWAKALRRYGIGDVASRGVRQHWGYMGRRGLGTLLLGGDFHKGFGHFKLRSGKSKTCLAFEFFHS